MEMEINVVSGNTGCCHRSAGGDLDIVARIRCKIQLGRRCGLDPELPVGRKVWVGVGLFFEVAATLGHQAAGELRELNVADGQSGLQPRAVVGLEDHFPLGVVRLALVLHLQLTERCVGVVLKDDFGLTPTIAVLRRIVLQRDVGRRAFKLELRPWSGGADAQPIVGFIDHKSGPIDLKVSKDCGSTLAIEVVVEAH